MTKLFFLGIAIFALIVTGVFSAVMAPLMLGVNHNLGGSPQSPFHATVPGPVTSTAHGLLAQATPQVILTGLLGLAALLLIYSIGNFIRHGFLRHDKTRALRADQRRRARVTASRQYPEQSEQSVAISAAASQAEIDALWE